MPWDVIWLVDDRFRGGLLNIKVLVNNFFLQFDKATIKQGTYHILIVTMIKNVSDQWIVYWILVDLAWI